MGLRGGSVRRTGDTSPGKSLLEGGEKRSSFLELLSADSSHSFALHGCKTFEVYW